MQIREELKLKKLQFVPIYGVQSKSLQILTKLDGC